MKRKLMVVLAAGIFGLVFTDLSYSATYYVRTDGGSATQCTGLTDAAYPGTGTGKPCAFSHPFFAIAPIGNNSTKMSGGDTLIIDGSNGAQYRMGLGAPNIVDTGKCAASWPWDCYMRNVPSGSDPAHPTRILGKGWDNGCSNPPQLWANERVDRVINLVGSNNVEVQCLEVTDHSSCQQRGPNPCNESTAPYGAWGQTGLKASDSDNVLIKNVNIHGMAYRGVYAGRLKDWTIEDSKIVSNSFVGWDGDIGNPSSNSGTLMFNRVSILFNGCGETYPGKTPYNCYSQDQSGYGDGLGTYYTGGIWVFNNCDISHNVSDGLDLLYHTNNGSITVNRSRFEGNAGNQLKASGNTSITNSVMIGNCAYFAQSPLTWKTSTFNNCRAGGNPLAINFFAGTNATIYNSTLTSNGDTIIQTSGSGCNGNEKVVSRNNIYYGGTEFHNGADKAAVYFAAGATGNGDGGCGRVSFDDDYSIIWGTKNFASDCNGKPHSLCQDPKFVEPVVQYYRGDAYNITLQSNSPGRNNGVVLTGISGLDFNNFDRGSPWDIGAIEYGSVASNSHVVVSTPSPGSSSQPPAQTANSNTASTPPSGSTQNSSTTQTAGTSGSTTSSSSGSGLVSTTTSTQTAHTTSTSGSGSSGSGSSSGSLSSSSGSRPAGSSSGSSSSSSSTPITTPTSTQTASSASSGSGSSGSGSSTGSGSSASSSPGLPAPTQTTSWTTTTGSFGSDSTASNNVSTGPTNLRSTSSPVVVNTINNSTTAATASSSSTSAATRLASSKPATPSLTTQATTISPPPRSLTSMGRSTVSSAANKGSSTGTGEHSIGTTGVSETSASEAAASQESSSGVIQAARDIATKSSLSTETPGVVLAPPPPPEADMQLVQAPIDRNETAEIQSLLKRRQQAEAQNLAQGRPASLSIKPPLEEDDASGVLSEDDQKAKEGKESGLQAVKKWVDGVVNKFRGLFNRKKS